MKLLNFTIIKFTICLILGILIGFYFEISPRVSICSSGLFVLLTSIGFLVLRSKISQTIWFGLLTYLTLVSLGVLTETLHDQKNFSEHYTNFISIEPDEEQLIQLNIKERLKPDLYSEKYIANVLNIDKQNVLGKVLLSVKKDTFNNRLKLDDKLLVSGELTEVNKPFNPYQFDYRAYLARQNVFRQISVEHNSMLKLESNETSAFGFAGRLRDNINIKLKEYNFKSNELAIINALLLGQRQDMDRAVYQEFINAGVVHVLAVSGLHIGIMLLILNNLLKPIERLRHGFFIKTILLIALLWSYAIIAGLSPSITRAVAMFTVVAIGMNLKRPANIYNTLAISMFFILLVKPMFIFEVGFQLSYTAVFAIVTIQPLLYKLWLPKWKATDYLWQIFTVTIAAQIGVAPISIFYFHQFPSLFFVANMVIIPFLPLILGIGILVIVLALLNGLPNFLAEFYGGIINLMNTIVRWVSEKEQFLVENISLSLFQMIFIYLFFISLILWIRRPKYKRFMTSLGCILLIQVSFLVQTYQNQSNHLVVFHKSRYSIIGQKTAVDLRVFHNLDSSKFRSERIVKDYVIGNFVDRVYSDSIRSYYKFKANKILLVDSLGIYNIKSFQPDYVLLRNSPRVNLERLIDSLNPKQIIADGSNYKPYTERWNRTCAKNGVEFHNTREDGAFIFE
ncbi:MAG: ComEC/Rec2 family competence protein [Bacteroidota bacterium]